MNTYQVFLLFFIVTLSLNLQAQSNDAIITQSTSLRMEANSESRSILRLASNDQLTLLNDCTTYYCKVEVNGVIGWVKKHLLKNINIESAETFSEVEEEADIEEEIEEYNFIEESISEETPLEEVLEATLPKEASNETALTNTTQLAQTSSYIPIYITIFSFFIITGLLFYINKITTQKKFLDNKLNEITTRYQATNKEFNEIKTKYQAIDDELNELQVKYLVKDNKYKKIQKKYQGIDDVQKFIEQQKKDHKNVVDKLVKQVQELQVSRKELNEKQEQATKIHHQLEQEIDLLKSDLDIIEHGVYEPQFDYETSDIFKLHITEIRNIQKQMVVDNIAITSGEEGMLGSTAKGRDIVSKQKKLMLRAFNSECNHFITEVKWNNEARMEERILSSAKMINKLGETQGLKISTKYTESKLQELRLTYEYQLKKQEEKKQPHQI